MATISSPPSSLYCHVRRVTSPSPSSSSFPSLRLGRVLSLSLQQRSKPFPVPLWIARAAVEEETLVPEGGGGGEAPVAATEEEEKEAVSIPVSPSDMLTMFFKAEGTMNESAIPAITKALEGVEGISDLVVQIVEGIASVELTKQTTVQATGVASNLVEIIQGSGFKLQTLSLSFEDEEDAIK
ncbi:uncharacterized protein [Typha angustifolia]|uniref:uncharacterized protein n=1 Tax=Typha angustifolia TaxID=59011 RepID=UPI003C2DF8E3